MEFVESKATTVDSNPIFLNLFEAKLDFPHIKKSDLDSINECITKIEENSLQLWITVDVMDDMSLFRFISMFNQNLSKSEIAGKISINIVKKSGEIIFNKNYKNLTLINGDLILNSAFRVLDCNEPTTIKPQTLCFKCDSYDYKIK